MTSQPAKNHSPAFKAEVAFAAARMEKSLAELAKEYGVDAKDIADWRLQLQNAAMNAFTGENKPAPPRAGTKSPLAPSLPICLCRHR